MAPKYSGPAYVQQEATGQAGLGPYVAVAGFLAGVAALLAIWAFLARWAWR